MYITEVLDKLNIYSINSFNSCDSSRNGEHYKNQHSYKLMFYTSGSAYIEIGRIKQKCSSGDVVFLLPGDTYRVLNSYGDFSVINTYFGFDDKECVSPYTKQEYFNPSKCICRYSFKDAEILNSSFITYCRIAVDMAHKLIEAENLDAVPLDFIRKSSVCAIISMLITSAVNRNELKEKILACIEEHLTDEINVASAAKLLNIHPVQLNRLTRKYMGCTVSEYIMKTKLERAAIYLKETNESITNIAFNLGFFDSAHFSNKFKKYFGYTPLEYRRR